MKAVPYHTIKNTLVHFGFALVTLFLIQVTSYAGPRYEHLAVKHIPKELLENAVAVVRFDSTEFSLKGTAQYLYSQRRAITILKPEGKEYGMILERYSNLLKITSLKATLIDAEGNVLAKAKEREFVDIAEFAFDVNFHSDSRQKRFSFSIGHFPYTVLIETETEGKSTLFLPTWYPQINAEVAVQEAVLIASHPEDLSFRYKAHKMPENYEHHNVAGEKENTEIFTISQVKGFKPQPYARVGNFTLPTIEFFPSTFELLGYKGDMSSWESLGKFIYKLNEGRDELPEDKKAVVKELVAGVSDPYERVGILYRYMQNNTRYFANLFGIAGWQTFDAKSVAQFGYGDCKGLTNYLRALLKEAGITSYSTLVSAGDGDQFEVDPNVPGNYFNHVILCVPLKQDTIWLECTSQTLPSGYLSNFTQDRWVLITTENGGILSRTPTYGLKENFIHRKVNMELSEANLMTVSMANSYSGLLQDRLYDLIKSDDQQQLKKYANTKFSFPSYTVNQFSYKNELLAGIPKIEEMVQAKVSGATSQSGKRQFVQLNWLPNPMIKIYQDMKRTEPLVLDRSYTIVDTILVAIPVGAQVEQLPQSVTLRKPFGKYVFEAVEQDETITIIRHFEQYKGVYEPELFEDYQSMYKRINAGSSNANIVLVNQ